jgi:two-component system, cell cycle sensor histidine kinase and response regulator CckA
MPQGGALSAVAQNVVIGSKSLLPLPPGEYVKISFADQGIGMTAEAQARIFDPYFTTKRDGTGLGLASVHSIVSKHGGHVEVSSSLGVGTTFDFYLPSTGAVWQGVQGELEPLRSNGQDGGTILVMDDEEMICKVLTEMLKKLGCRTVTSNEGSEAVELYRSAFEAGAPFAAVILDLTVPGGMGGREAAQQIIALDPAARVIVSSGYSNDPVMAEYRSHGLSGAVLKPYRVAELAQGLAFLQEPAANGGRAE